MTFELLAEKPNHIPLVANWLYEEWGKPEKGHSPTQLAKKLKSRMSLNSLPMHLLAFEKNVPVGFVALKLYEMEEYSDREHWLGSLFVTLEKRKLGIGSALIQEAVDRAKGFGITTLSLQTERLDGGIYKKFGWIEVEEIVCRKGRILIMERTNII